MQEKELKENELIELRKEVDNIYTPLAIAKEEIWRRWNDQALEKKL